MNNGDCKSEENENKCVKKENYNERASSNERKKERKKEKREKEKREKERKKERKKRAKYGNGSWCLGNIICRDTRGRNGRTRPKHMAPAPRPWPPLLFLIVFVLITVIIIVAIMIAVIIAIVTAVTIGIGDSETLRESSRSAGKSHLLEWIEVMELVSGWAGRWQSGRDSPQPWWLIRKPGESGAAENLFRCQYWFEPIPQRNPSKSPKRTAGKPPEESQHCLQPPNFWKLINQDLVITECETRTLLYSTILNSGAWSVLGNSNRSDRLDWIGCRDDLACHSGGFVSARFVCFVGPFQRLKCFESHSNGR